MNRIERRKFLHSKTWHLFRKQIIKRDDSICQLCGVKTKHPKIHHIVQDKSKYDLLIPSDFVVLCSSCHDFISTMIPRKNINKKISQLIMPFYRQ